MGIRAGALQALEVSQKRKLLPQAQTLGGFCELSAVKEKLVNLV